MPGTRLTPPFREPEIAQLARAWRIQPQRVELLYGEFDLNYRITSGRERWVLKLRNDAHPEAGAFVEFQAKLLQHLEQESLETAVPRIRPCADGSVSQVFTDAAGRRWWAWLLTYLEGDLLERLDQYSNSLLQSLGFAVAEVDAALLGFQHDHASRPLLWCSLGILQHRRLIPRILDRQRRQLASQAFSYLEHVLPGLAALPTSVIHNDGGNQHNMLITRKNVDWKIHAMIDFGDAIQSPRICGLGTAIAYASFHSSQKAAFEQVTRGYETCTPIPAREREFLFAAVLARWLATVTVAADRAAANPCDDYAITSAESAWNCLARLAGTDFARQARIAASWTTS